jgi:hypothetical protein
VTDGPSFGEKTLQSDFGETQALKKTRALGYKERTCSQGQQIRFPLFGTNGPAEENITENILFRQSRLGK